MLLNWLAKMNEAKKAVEKYKVSDPALYKTLEKHISIETIFPRFALCNLHANTYTPEEIRDLRLAFKRDAESLGVVEHMEHFFIDTVYASWGI